MLLGGCQGKQGAGTLAEATLGSVAGIFLGDGAAKALAVTLGAIAGGIAGSLIGGDLEEEGRLAVERESSKALSQSQDGQTSTWGN